MKIKVLRIMHRINVGGPTYHATYLTKYMNSNLFETRLISGNLDANEKSGKYILDSLNVDVSFVKHMFRKINLFKDFLAFLEIRKIIKDFQPDIIHTHAAKSGSLGRLAAFSQRVPVVIHTFHGHVFHSYFSNIKTKIFIHIERYLAKKSSKIIAISKLQKDELVNIFKIAKDEKFSIVPLGFDLQRFNTDKELKRKYFREEFNIKDDEVAIGIVGRLAKIKNHHLFINAINLLKLNKLVKIRAFIIGDGEELNDLQDLCKKLNLPFNTIVDKVFDKTLCFTSWKKDMDIVNAGLDIMTLTSFNEGTPVSLIEAQASCLPIVTTNVGGIRDVVYEGKTALISEDNDLEDFSSKLLYCIQNLPLRKKLALAGYEYVKDKFGRRRLVSDIEELYFEEILKSNNLSK